MNDFSKNFDDLLARYENSLHQNERRYFDIDELEEILDYYIWRGQLKEAARTVEDGLIFHPGNSVLQEKMVKIYLKKNEPQKALILLEKVGESDDIEYQLLKAETYLVLQKEVEAEDIFTQLLKNNDDLKEELCLDISDIYSDKRKFERSLKYLNIAFKINSKNIDTLTDLAFCYDQLSQPEKSILFNKKIIEIDPFYMDAWFNLGQTYFIQENYEEALDAYEYVTAVNDQDTIATMQKGATLIHLGRYDEALKAYQEYEKLTDFKSNAHVYIGECFEKMEQFQNAKQSYLKALEFDKDNVDALTGCGICLIELGAYKESLSYLNKALELEPELYSVLDFIAEAYMNLGDSDSAVLNYKKSLDIEPEQPITLTTLGHIYLDTEKFSDALDCYLKAYAFDKEVENLRIFIAIAYFHIGDYEKMLLFIEESIRFNSETVTIFFDLCPDAIDTFLRMTGNIDDVTNKP